MGVNRLIEPDTNQLGNFCVNDEIMLIMGEQLANFRVSFLLPSRAGCGSLCEKLVAGLGLVLAFLQPERKYMCIPVQTWPLNPAVRVLFRLVSPRYNAS